MIPQKKGANKLYLASNSPRRRELLSTLGLEFQLLPAQVNETPLPHEDGVTYVKRIARSKAISATSQPGAGGVILAADTAVILQENRASAEILGKPGNREEAVEMLRKLRGRTHQVFTALSIIHTQSGTILSDLCTTDVPMRNYSDQDIEAYVDGGDPMDKAGAYAIQHAGFHPVDKLHGCFANVMGLPLCHLTRTLSQLAITPLKDVPHECQAALSYDCPVYHSILTHRTPNFSMS